MTTPIFQLLHIQPKGERMNAKELLEILNEIASTTAQGLNSDDLAHHSAALNDIQGILLKAGLSES